LKTINPEAMPVLFVFLLKVNIALLLFCAGYYLVLRHLTFYTLNRIYLITAILFASVYPQINLSGFAERHQELANPVQAVVFQLQAPAETFIKPFTRPNYWYWAEVAFWVGAALLAIRLLIQLYSLYKLYRDSTASKLYDHDIRIIAGNAAPFSFWKSIYVNPANHDPADLKSIILHEQVHVNEWHTLDIMLAELSTIFYWFNPGVWLMKKAVRENIEFITDRKIIKNGIDSKAYQYSLVSVSFASTSHTIVNHFNISTIKKRIIMMNAKRSSKFNLTRYAFLVPAVIILLLVFSVSKAALIKKGKVAYKAIENTVSKIEKDIKPGNKALSNANQIAANAPVNIAKRINVADSVRNGNVSVSSSDTLSFVINGVKATKAEFKALDPDHIKSVDFMTPTQAAKLVDNINPKHSVLFVTTDNSEAGKKFKEKIDSTIPNDRMMAARAMTLSGTSKGGNVIVMGGRGGGGGRGAYAGSLNGVDSIFVNGHKVIPMVGMTMPPMTKSYRFDSLRKRGVIRVYSTKRDSLGRAKPMINGVSASGFYSLKVDSLYSTRHGGGGRIVYDHNAKADSLLTRLTLRGGQGVRMMRYDSINGKKLGTYSINGMMAATAGSRQTTISGIQSSLVMIDGKEASEKDMKKLPASEIESIRVNKGEEMTKKYGDKAKNGVVFITTKKAN
jgi:bla regulator protein BlaR1